MTTTKNTAAKTRKPAARKTYTPEQRAEFAEQRDQAVKAAHAQIAEAVTAITTSEEWKAYLTFGARFYNYSFNNVVLMWAQQIQREMRPLRRVASFRKWADMGHPVRKGEKGLRIFAPVIVPIREGEPGYVPGEKRTKLVGFKVVSTFDQQQITDEDTLPTDPTAGMFNDREIGGEAPEGMFDGLVALAKDAGYSFRFGTDCAPAEAHTDEQAHEIVMHPKYEGTTRAVLIMVHEVAHMIRHTGKDDDGQPLFNYRAHRGLAETEAEGIAFVVATYFGIDPGTTSAGYVAGWSKDGEADMIVKAGTAIMQTSKKIINSLSEHVIA